MTRRTLQFAFVLLVPIISWFTYQYFSWNKLHFKNSLPKTTHLKNENFKSEIERASEILKKIPFKLNVPSVSVAVGIEGEVIWSEAVGFATVKNRIPATPETAYRMGGTAKSITSVALMTLVNQHLITLDTPINTHIPNLDKNIPDITLRQLLSHTSGIGNHGDFGLLPKFYVTCDCIQFNSVDEALSLFIKHPLLFKPGTKYRYSTYGYIVASKVIESISRKPFLTFLQEDVFEPLQMYHSFGDHDSYQSAPVATFYEISKGRFREWHSGNFITQETNLSYNWAGSGIFSTPSDMVKLGNMLLNENSLIPSKIRQEFLQPQLFLNGKPIKGKHNALGWEVKTNYTLPHVVTDEVPITIIKSGGRKKGSGNLFILFPNFNLVIDISINGSKDHYSVDKFWSQAMNISRPFLKKIYKETLDVTDGRTWLSTHPK